jgi:hypothetical protein
MKLFSRYDRFDLEQDIMKAWSVTELIEELIRQHLDRPEGAFDEDELANRLQAIQYVTEMNFQRLWDGFEVMLKNGQFTRIGEAVPHTDNDKLFEILTKKKGKKK